MVSLRLILQIFDKILNSIQDESISLSLQTNSFRGLYGIENALKSLLFSNLFAIVFHVYNSILSLMLNYNQLAFFPSASVLTN